MSNNMEDPYNTIYKIGDHLIIELSTGQIFEGDYSDAGKNHIELINVKQHNNANKLGGVYSFYRNEIINIYKHRCELSYKPKKKEEVPEKLKNIQLAEEEYNRLKQLCKEAIYLEQADDKYFKSIEKLSEAETIGIISLGTDENTMDILRLLVICTWKQIYIFDLVNFRYRKFYPELKNILESEYITKVTHGGSSIINSLYNIYDVYVKTTFDTQIVDLILEKSKMATLNTTIDISQCLVKYLNFPPSLLNDALSVTRKCWTERPLNEENRFYACQLVVYLIPLRDCMTKKLLSNVYKAIDDVHNLYFNLDQFTYSDLIKKSKVTKEINNLIPVLSCDLDGRKNKNETT